MATPTSNTLTTHMPENDFFFLSDLPETIQAAINTILAIPGAGNFKSRKAARRNHEKQDTALLATLQQLAQDNPLSELNTETNCLKVQGYELRASTYLRKSDADPDTLCTWISLHLYHPAILLAYEEREAAYRTARELETTLRKALETAITYPDVTRISDTDPLTDAFVEGTSRFREQVIMDLQSLTRQQDALNTAIQEFATRYGLTAYHNH